MTNDIASELAKLHELTGAEFSRQVERIAQMKVFHPLDTDEDIFAIGRPLVCSDSLFGSFG